MKHRGISSFTLGSSGGDRSVHEFDFLGDSGSLDGDAKLLDTRLHRFRQFSVIPFPTTKKVFRFISLIEMSVDKADPFVCDKVLRDFLPLRFARIQCRANGVKKKGKRGIEDLFVEYIDAVFDHSPQTTIPISIVRVQPFAARD